MLLFLGKYLNIHVKYDFLKVAQVILSGANHSNPLKTLGLQSTSGIPTRRGKVCKIHVTCSKKINDYKDQEKGVQLKKMQV